MSLIFSRMLSFKLFFFPYFHFRESSEEARSYDSLTRSDMSDFDEFNDENDYDNDYDDY